MFTTAAILVLLIKKVNYMGLSMYMEISYENWMIEIYIYGFKMQVS